MDAEHHLPPAAPLDALAAIARLDERHLRHIRACTRCRVAWYQSGAFRAGCIDPRLGVRALGLLDGRHIDATVRAHLERCLACRVLLLEAMRATGVFVPMR